MALSPIDRSPLDLVRSAGRTPFVAAAALALACSGAAAQNSQVMGARPVNVSTPSQPASAQPREGGPQVRVSDHMTVDLHVKDEDLVSVLELLSIQTQKNIIASKSVSARVSATLYNVTFYEALDAILHVNGFGYIEQGNFIYVYTLQELEEIQKALSKRVAKVIRLNYLNAADAAEFVRPLISSGGEIKTSAKADNFSIPDNAPVGADAYALGATLVVIDYEQNIEAVERLIAELDTKPAQVLVEATVVQTALTEANAFGVDFSIIGDLNFTDFIGVGGPRRVADALILGGEGRSPDGLSPLDNRGRAIQSTPGKTDGPGTFKLGVIADDVSIFMRLLDEVSDTTIISNPKILALNRMPARVLVGRRVGYLNTTSTETSTTQTVQFLDTGTQLYFRPFVGKDNSIRLELKPQVSEAIIRQASDATGAAVSIPDEVTQEITTNVIVRDGQTIVLGGLFRESTQFTRRQVPFLGDIPIIGAAFRGHDDDTNRSEIIFMITPTIVTDALIDQSAAMAMGDVERLRAGARQGLLPWSREKMTSIHNLEAEHFARSGEFEKALWHIQRSLALNAHQPEVFRLRERITGEREIWPDRSILQDAMGDETRRMLESIVPPEAPARHLQPYGHHPVPREEVAPPALRPPADPGAEPMSAAPDRSGRHFVLHSAFDEPHPTFGADLPPARQDGAPGQPGDPGSFAPPSEAGQAVAQAPEPQATQTPAPSEVIADAAPASSPANTAKAPAAAKQPASLSALGVAQPAAAAGKVEPLVDFDTLTATPTQVASSFPEPFVLIPQAQFSPWFSGVRTWNWVTVSQDFFTLNSPMNSQPAGAKTVTTVPTP